MQMFGKRNVSQGPAVDNPYPHQCSWAQSTPHRCQMLGTLGYGLPPRPDLPKSQETGLWFCTLHYFENHGQRQPELRSFEALLVWLHHTSLRDPETQWNDDPQCIWERLHGTWKTTAMYEPRRPEAGDGEIPTRQELDKILSRLKPGLWARVITQAMPPRRVPDEPHVDEISPSADARVRAQARRETQLPRARDRGLIP